MRLRNIIKNSKVFEISFNNTIFIYTILTFSLFLASKSIKIKKICELSHVAETEPSDGK